jgi:hypothetical protein
MRKYGRVDANQKAIILALRMVGCSVCSLADLGDGVPDLLIGLRGQTYLAEVKDGAKRPSQRTLTADQRDWLKEWRGGPVVLLTSTNAAVEWARNPTGAAQERIKLSAISPPDTRAKAARKAG